MSENQRDYSLPRELVRTLADLDREIDIIESGRGYEYIRQKRLKELYIAREETITNMDTFPVHTYNPKNYLENLVQVRDDSEIPSKVDIRAAQKRERDVRRTLRPSEIPPLDF